MEKKIHYCWFGRGKKSKLIEKCIASWKVKCPDYEIIEWNEDNYDIHKNKWMEEAYNNGKFAFAADYARLDIIYTHGGFYLDVDVELIKSLDEIANKDVDAFFCFAGEHVSAGLGFGANPKNEVIKELLSSYDDVSFVNANGEFDVTPYPVRSKSVFDRYTGVISEAKTIENVLFLPDEYFNPFNPSTNKLNSTKNTIGIHWYSATWYTPKQKFLHKMKVIFIKIFGEKAFDKLIKKIRKS